MKGRRSFTRSSWTADLTGAVIAAFLLFACYLSFYESKRPTWVSLTGPILLTPTLPALQQAEFGILWHGIRQRDVCDARWEYVVTNLETGAPVHKAEYSATSYVATPEGQEEGPVPYIRPLPRLPAGDYELAVLERTQMYCWLPVWWVHEQARFPLRVE